MTFCRERFRLSPEAASSLEDVIAASIAHETGRNHALSPREQLLVTLRFYATGSFFRMVADGRGPHEATVCRAVHRVTDAIVQLCPQAVSWPTDPDSLDAIKTTFSA